jgi:hypothetical protein
MSLTDGDIILCDLDDGDSGRPPEDEGAKRNAEASMANAILSRKRPVNLRRKSLNMLLCHIHKAMSTDSRWPDRSERKYTLILRKMMTWTPSRQPKSRSLPSRPRMRVRKGMLKPAWRGKDR